LNVDWKENQKTSFRSNWILFYYQFMSNLGYHNFLFSISA
jgi:hypothetical protein